MIPSKELNKISVQKKENKRNERSEGIIEKYSTLIQEAKSQKAFWIMLYRYLKTHQGKIEGLEVSTDKFLEVTGT